MSNNGGDNFNDNEDTLFDRFQRYYGDREEHLKHEQYDELGLDKWEHKDPQGEHGGIAWKEAEHYSDYDQAKDRFDELWKHRDDISYITSGQGRELAEIRIYLNNNYKWEIDYTIFIRGARGDSPGKKRGRRRRSR